MPGKYEADVTCATPEVTRIAVTLNGVKVSLDADASGNWSGTKNMDLPDTFLGAIHIRSSRPTKWTVSIEVSTDGGGDYLKKDITGTIKQADEGIAEWTGQLTLTPPAPTANTAVSKPKAAAKFPRKNR